ncbi:MAG: 5'/3'-nucleotidase SurE [Maricaulaceae bacterium]|jgi:5'-nucleotidase
MTFPSNPRILLSNDDGVQAPGLACLEEIASALSDDVWVVAPADEQSGASRKISFTDPVLVHQLGERRFAVRGTPSDAVFLGVHDIVPGKRVDLVLSGVNRGQNLAEDVSVSGTVAAAIQGMSMGVPSIALSQSLAGMIGRDAAPFETAAALAPALLQRLLAAGWRKDVVLNVNFPPCPPAEAREALVTRQGWRDQWDMTADKREDLRGRAYYWIGYHGKKSNPSEGDDLHAIYNNHVSVTPLHVDLTHEPSLAALESALTRESSDS